MLIVAGLFVILLISLMRLINVQEHADERGSKQFYTKRHPYVDPADVLACPKIHINKVDTIPGPYGVAKHLVELNDGAIFIHYGNMGHLKDKVELTPVPVDV
jgi:hypothetical protein